MCGVTLEGLMLRRWSESTTAYDVEVVKYCNLTDVGAVGSDDWSRQCSHVEQSLIMAKAVLHYDS